MLSIKSDIRPSDKQVEAAGGDVLAAKARMLDWHTHMRRKHADTEHVRIALGDFAVVPGAAWQHPQVAKSRGLEEHTPLNGGEVGASVVQTAVGEDAALQLRGAELLRYISKRLLEACLAASPGTANGLEAQRAVLREDRQYAPTGYLAVADITTSPSGRAEFDITQIGDVFVALDTGTRIPRVLQGSVQQRAYAGEMILGEEKRIDVLKGELKQWIAAKYPNVSDQFFYDLIFNGTFRPQFIPHSVGDVEAFKAIVTAELRQYACTKYAAQGLTGDIFDRMIEKGMTPWQQKVAQNNPHAGPFWYPALDPIGDTPEEGVSRVRFAIDDILQQNPVRLVLWTDGSKPREATGITMDNLDSVNAYGEQTRMEVEMQ
jgi:hypothetical protein